MAFSARVSPAEKRPVFSQQVKLEPKKPSAFAG